MYTEQPFHGPELCEFSPATPTEQTSLAKSKAILDSIPESLMNDWVSVLFPVFVDIYDQSVFQEWFNAHAFQGSCSKSYHHERLIRP